MTREFIDFVNAHQDEDTVRLLLSAARYPDIDMPSAVQQIEGLQTAREKWPSLLQCEEFLYPPRLNREQASSEETARYKAGSQKLPPGSVADLTGGMGIDSIAFAQTDAQVDYVERNETLCALMKHNCDALGLKNIACIAATAWNGLPPPTATSTCSSSTLPDARLRDAK